MPHIRGAGEMGTGISDAYVGRWGDKHWKSRRMYVALGHDELNRRYLDVLHFITSPGTWSLPTELSFFNFEMTFRLRRLPYLKLHYIDSCFLAYHFLCHSGRVWNFEAIRHHKLSPIFVGLADHKNHVPFFSTPQFPPQWSYFHP